MGCQIGYVIQWNRNQCSANQLHLTFPTKTAEYKKRAKSHLLPINEKMLFCLGNQLDPVRHY